MFWSCTDRLTVGPLLPSPGRLPIPPRACPPPVLCPSLPAVAFLRALTLQREEPSADSLLDTFGFFHNHSSLSALDLVIFIRTSPGTSDCLPPIVVLSISSYLRRVRPDCQIPNQETDRRKIVNIGYSYISSVSPLAHSGLSLSPLLLCWLCSREKNPFQFTPCGHSFSLLDAPSEWWILSSGQTFDSR